MTDSRTISEDGRIVIPSSSTVLSSARASQSKDIVHLYDEGYVDRDGHIQLPSMSMSAGPEKKEK